MCAYDLQGIPAQRILTCGLPGAIRNSRRNSKLLETIPAVMPGKKALYPEASREIAELGV